VARPTRPSRHVRRLRFGDRHEEGWAVPALLKKMPGERLSPAEGEGTLCAALVETDDKTASPGRSGPSGWGAAYRLPTSLQASCIPQRAVPRLLEVSKDGD
jgi:hypothetical protein